MSLWPVVIRSCLTLSGLFIVAAPAAALSIDYSGDRPEQLAPCDADYHHGRILEAASCYSDLVAASTDPRIRAEAAWGLGDYVAAGDFFREAIEAFPEDPRVRYRWGRLFGETFKESLEVDLYQEALEIDPEYVPALIGLAQAAAQRFEGRSREWLNESLRLDPEALEAHLLVARMELEVGNLESADVSLDRALELAEKNGHPPLEVFALKASADLLRDEFESPWIDRALEFNPRYGDAYAIPAYFFIITRRYREAINYYERAVELQPDNYIAHTELGVNLLRENRISESYDHLRTSHSLFGYDEKTTNTLNLIDSFDNFSVETYDATTDPMGAREGVILRLHNDEADILTPYVLDLINDSIEVFSERYAFDPAEPIIAELYPEESDFSVRTAGLPGIGLLGVTFGYLVAMNSPPPGREGGFHWGTTLWHEIAHVFTLEATDHLVPRWFSEGVSVFEEWSTGPLRGRHIPSHVLQAMSEGLFLPIADLDEGFIRPVYDNQVIVSYMQAGLICEYIAASFGQQALQTMLVRFREGDDTPAALEAAISIPAEEFDRRFAEHIEAEFGTTLANLEPWMEAQQQVQEHANAANWTQVIEPAQRAVELIPEYVDSGSAWLYLARAQRELDQPDAALATLKRYYELGGYAPDALLQLGRWLRDEGDTDAAIEVFEALNLVSPLDDTVHAELGDLLIATRPADALREFEVLAALDPHDKAALNLRIAKAQQGLGDTEKATEYLLYALEIAPLYREAQELLLEIVR